MSFFKKHWKGLAGLGCGVAAVVVAPFNPIAALGIGAICTTLGVTQSAEYAMGMRVGDAIKLIQGTLKK